MFCLSIGNDRMSFKDIKPVDLPSILNWYNKVDDFKFATGISTPITLERLKQKYAEVAISSTEFFVGIYIKPENKMIGILKGSLKYNNQNALWISSIVIDTEYQNRGYGQCAIRMLMEHMIRNTKITAIYLAVIEENCIGRSFWTKLGFAVKRKMESHLELQNKKQNVIIMHKSLS